VVASADADVVPDPTTPTPPTPSSARSRTRCGRELAARKRRLGLLAYDDLLLAPRALRDPDRGDAAVEVLRGRYRWALVDEFQDTDPVQWDILDRAFRDPTDPAGRWC
jgi:exodeoxyribonuclease V beta subunit